jgi:hypothetical protein
VAFDFRYKQIMKILTFLLGNLQCNDPGFNKQLNNHSMKYRILFILLIIGVSANSQSLKDLLYSGKLKSDSNTVIKKDDDLKSKIDTTTKKPAVAAQKLTLNKPDSLMADSMVQAGSDVTTGTEKQESKSEIKDNNVLWKEFADAVATTINNEVMPDKKIKKGNYFIIVDYEIGTDGQITIKNILSTPGNSLLEQQVKERFSIDTPKLNPVMTGNGTPRKVNKRYSFNLAKK